MTTIAKASTAIAMRPIVSMGRSWGIHEMSPRRAALSSHLLSKRPNPLIGVKQDFKLSCGKRVEAINRHQSYYCTAKRTRMLICIAREVKCFFYDRGGDFLHDADYHRY